MPQVAAAWIASAITSAGTAAGGLAAAGAAAGAVAAGGAAINVTALLSVAIEAGLYAAASAVLAPKTQAAEGRATEWTPDPDAPIPFVFGQRGVAGTIVHREAWGQNNRYQSIISVYSGAGPVSALGTTYVDGAAVTFTGELMDGSPTNRLWRQTKVGAQPETAHTTSSITGSYSMAAWSSSHKLSGKASSCVTLRQDGDFKYWPTGEPKYVQLVNGLLCYDPRQDSTYPGGSGSCRLNTRSTWVYSTNGAIHALNWVIGLFENGVQVGGIGAPFASIDTDAFIAAANIADANSWTSSVACWSDAPGGDDKYEVLVGMLQTCCARPASKAGKISCVSMAANGSSVATITSADVIGPFEYDGMAAREGRFNTVIPRRVSADHDWENVDDSPVTNSTYVTEDGGATRSRGITYTYVSNANQAAQLARYDIANSREGISGTITVRPYLRDIDPGECFTINESEYGMSSLKCLCLSREYDPATDGVRITFRSETAAKHAWALAGTGTAPATPTLGGDDPTTVPTPSGSDWTLAAGTGSVPSFTITGAVPSTLTVSKVVVEHKSNAGSDWKPLGEFSPDTTKIEESGIVAGTSWIARMAYRNLAGALGSWFTFASPVTSGFVEGGDIKDDTVDTPQMAEKAVVASGRYLDTSTLTQVNQSSGSTFGNLVIEFSVDIPSDVTGITLEYYLDQQTSGTNAYYYVLYVDGTYSAPSGTPVGYDKLFTFNEASSASVRLPKLFFYDLSLTAGSHTLRLYLRNTSGGSISLYERRLKVMVERKSAL